MCWICLDGSKPDVQLVQPCNCPRFAHKHCLARWQLQSAGTRCVAGHDDHQPARSQVQPSTHLVHRRETRCEFCDCALPDWKRTLTPPCGATAPAVMNVNFDGRTYSFEVKPGPDGYKAFTEAIRRAFSLPQDSELNITFTCDEPTTAPVMPGACMISPRYVITFQPGGTVVPPAASPGAQQLLSWWLSLPPTVPHTVPNTLQRHRLTADAPGCRRV